MKGAQVRFLIVSSFVLAFVSFVSLPASFAGPSPAVKCQASKLFEAGKLGACLLQAESKAAKKGVEADLDKCLAKFETKWGRLDEKSGGLCPTLGDAGTMATVVEAHRADVYDRLGAGYGDLASNAAFLEIAGILSTGSDPNMVVVQGPGFTIERIAGFSVDGNPYDTPGNSTDLALVFEHIPPAFGVDTDGIALAQAFAEQQAGVFSPRALSLILRKTNGTEVGRWNLYEAAPVTMTVGTDGRDRYRWQSQIAPPAVAAFEFAGGTFDATLADAFDPDEDSRVEVSGIGDYFPKVSDDAANRLLTMTLFFDETESLYQWARDARNGSAGAKR